MIVIFYIMQNSFEWQNWMIVNLLVGIVQAQALKAMRIQLSLLKKQLATTMQCIDSAAERSDAFAIEGNMNSFSN